MDTLKRYKPDGDSVKGGLFFRLLCDELTVRSTYLKHSDLYYEIYVLFTINFSNRRLKSSMIINYHLQIQKLRQNIQKKNWDLFSKLEQHKIKG